MDSTLHQAAVEDSDGRAQMDSTLHQAAVLLFEQGDVNLPARVSPEASLNKIVCRMREKHKHRSEGSVVSASVQNMVLQVIHRETLAERANQNFDNGPYDIWERTNVYVYVYVYVNIYVYTYYVKSLN